MVDRYKSDFELFLSHTNEKPVLLEEIQNDLKRLGVRSVLDIGAGNGDLSIPLSANVERYVAVEKRHEFFEKLQNENIETIEAEFPISVEGEFDLVLSSHSMSYKSDKFKPFVNEAWELVKPQGTFLVITYRGQEDDWTNLMKRVYRDPIDYNRVGYEELTGLLRSLGKFDVRKVITTVTTDSIEDMMQALSFVASNGVQERKDTFLSQKDTIGKILKENYFEDGKYIFPFQHFFIYTTKS